MSRILGKKPSHATVTTDNLTSVSRDFYYPLELLHLCEKFLRIEKDLDVLRSTRNKLYRESTAMLNTDADMLLYRGSEMLIQDLEEMQAKLFNKGKLINMITKGDGIPEIDDPDLPQIAIRPVIWKVLTLHNETVEACL